MAIPRAPITDKQWEIFFAVISNLVNDDGAWRERKQRLLEKMKEENAETEFEEFLGWFGGDLVGD